MKETLAKSLVFAVAAQILGLQEARTLGTLYFSNIDVGTSGTTAVGSDAWLAAGLYTGTNPAASYNLSSVELRLDHISGSPSGLKVSIWDQGANRFPGSPVGSLAGVDPGAGGVFKYSTSGIVLQPLTFYFIVLTSDTPVAIGSYSFGSVTNGYIYSSVDGWRSAPGPASSSDGLTWGGLGRQVLPFAVEASVIPEPSSLALAASGVVLVALRRFRRKRREASHVVTGGALVGFCDDFDPIVDSPRAHGYAQDAYQNQNGCIKVNAIHVALAGEILDSYAEPVMLDYAQTTCG